MVLSSGSRVTPASNWANSRNKVISCKASSMAGSLKTNLAVRRRKKVKRTPNERVPLQIARKVNEVWSMDFVSDSLPNRASLFVSLFDDLKLLIGGPAPAALNTGDHFHPVRSY